MTSRPPPAPSTSRSAETEDLIARKATDIERWRERENLATQWDQRAKLASGLIEGETVRILDIGAGAMALKGFLPPGCQYTPADVAKRSDDCLVVDLNREEFPPGSYDYVSFLGVLEYIHDAAWPLRTARRSAAGLIVTYCTATSDDTAYRRGMGWVNDYTKDQFERLLGDTGWSIGRCVEYKRSPTNVQYIWKCSRSTADAETST